MALEPFATPDDLAERLGRELTTAEQSQAARLLADASNLIRAAAGYQQISRVTNDVATLRGSGRIGILQAAAAARPGRHGRGRPHLGGLVLGRRTDTLWRTEYRAVDRAGHRHLQPRLRPDRRRRTRSPSRWPATR
jgi:hypothetical protein